MRPPNATHNDLAASQSGQHLPPSFFLLHLGRGGGRGSSWFRGICQISRPLRKFAFLESLFELPLLCAGKFFGPPFVLASDFGSSALAFVFGLWTLIFDILFGCSSARPVPHIVYTHHRCAHCYGYRLSAGTYICLPPLAAVSSSNTNYLNNPPESNKELSYQYP